MASLRFSKRKQQSCQLLILLSLTACIWPLFAAAAAAQQDAERALREQTADIEFSAAAAMLAEATARQRTLAELRKRRR